MMKDEERVQDGLQSLSVKNASNTKDEAVVAMKKEQEGDSDVASSADHSKHSQSHSPSTSLDEPKSSSDSASILDNIRPKVTRKTSHKIPPRPAHLFSDLPDMTEESKDYFQVIPECLYGSKSLGSTEHDSLDCDCTEDWHDGENHACGDDSDCINRATKMECVDRECNCGDGCQNQRFQRKQYADVSVIKTEKKGFGLRANTELQANDFIFEYIGEVINEPTFRRRMLQYDQEGIKHFYFMSLTKNEFVDATKKGNLGRFCNHSCNPNCYVDKWVVGNKLRMGIFAGRRVQAGEELVFNYNVDRYGADPQPCYCGEPNCIGFIGGKTQSGRATKLSDATIQALGIDDADGWDTTVAVVKKPRKKRVNEDDEDYVNSVEARGLDERGVQKVMAALVQCKEKWIAVKLLERIQRGDDSLLPYVVRMHGYEFLKTTLNTFKDDYNVVLQILDILYRFPRLTRNKITDSKIETVVQPLTGSKHEEVAEESKRLLDEWSKLETGYRIPRKNRNAQGTPNTHSTNSFEDRRAMRSEESLHKTVLATPLPDNVPKGPRSSVPQRNASFFNQRHHRRPPDQASLPEGWYIATDKTGRWYFYTQSGATQWQRPTGPAPDAAHKGPSKAMQEQKTLQDIIDSLTRPESAAALRRSASQTPQQANTPVHETKQESWRSLPIEKQKRIYENTVFQHVKPVMDKYRRKLPKEEWKHHAKEATKTLVAKDYKHNRVSDPHAISEKWAKAAKTFAQEWFEKAVKRHNARDKGKSGRTADQSDDPDLTHIASLYTASTKEGLNGGALSEEEDANSTPASSDRKRKRQDTEIASASATPSETPSLKRVKEDEAGVSNPPPPPPPPPEADTSVDVDMTEHHEEEQQDEMQTAAQVAERQKLREQEAALERENELNMLDFEREQQNQHEVLSH